MEQKVNVAGLASAVKIPSAVAKKLNALNIRRTAIAEQLNNAVEAAMKAATNMGVELDAEAGKVWDGALKGLGMSPSQDLAADCADPDNAYFFSGADYRNAQEIIDRVMSGSVVEAPAEVSDASVDSPALR